MDDLPWVSGASASQDEPPPGSLEALIVFLVFISGFGGLFYYFLIAPPDKPGGDSSPLPELSLDQPAIPAADSPVIRSSIIRPLDWAEQSTAEVIPNFLSPSEVQAVCALAKDFTQHIGNASAAAECSSRLSKSVHEQLVPDHQRFLQQGNVFAEHEPKILEKIWSAAWMADDKHCWELMDHGINLRCVEYHEQSAGEDSQNAPYMDEGSAISMTIMLSSPTPLSGGTLLLWGGAAEESQKLVLQEGDAAVLVSQKRRCIEPVLSGKCCVLMIELWTGPSCTAAHRCDARTSCSSENLLEVARKCEAKGHQRSRSISEYLVEENSTKGHQRSRSISEYLVEENSTIGKNDEECDAKKTN